MLEDYPKEVILNDGTGVTLRPLQPGDEELLLALFKIFSEDDKWFLNHETNDPEVFDAWVKNKDTDEGISIVAVLEGRIIAHAALIGKSYGSRSHIGKIWISVDPSYREKRLGTWMLLELVNLAMTLGLETLVMKLVRGRDSAVMRGVKNLDFFEEAVLRDYIRDRGGNSYDLVIMVKHLHRGFDDF
jgi:ribosomal protein S18 acetylase RimI-like enzyme